MKHEKLRCKHNISDSPNTMEELSDAVFNEVNFLSSAKKMYPDGLSRFCDLHILLELLDRHDISLTSISNKNKHELDFEYSNESGSNSTFMIIFQSSNGHLGHTQRWADKDKVLMEKINSDWEAERTYDYKKNNSSKSHSTKTETLKEYLQPADEVEGGAFAGNDELFSSINNLLANISHLPDERILENLPDRRGAFKRGWVKGEESQYGEDVLSRITWDNLGSRIGGLIGNKSDVIKDLVFGYLKEIFVLSQIALGECPEELLHDDSVDGDEEGRVRHRQHRYRERSSNLRRKRLDRMYELDGRFFCECCEQPSPDSENPCSILEVHHVIPLSETAGVRRTTLDDLAVLCANCHRLIHAHMLRSGGHVSVEDLILEFFSE